MVHLASRCPIRFALPATLLIFVSFPNKHGFAEGLVGSRKCKWQDGQNARTENRQRTTEISRYEEKQALDLLENSHFITRSLRFLSRSDTEGIAGKTGGIFFDV